MKSAGESYKAERWLLHSLQVHMLSAQLRPLLRHLGHTRKYYNGETSVWNVNYSKKQPNVLVVTFIPLFYLSSFVFHSI